MKPKAVINNNQYDAIIKWGLTQRTGRQDAETAGLNMSQSTSNDLRRAQSVRLSQWLGLNLGHHTNEFDCLMIKLINSLRVSGL